MAGSAMFASKLLSTIVTPAFEQACFMWYAKDELDKLKRSIRTIQNVLLDAEKKQDSSTAVKNWIKRFRNVLYEADDFIDEVATDDKLKEHILKEGNKILSKVRVSCSRLNPIVSGYSIAKKVKAIRKILLEISVDMAQFEFVMRRNEAMVTGVRRVRHPGCFVDEKFTKLKLLRSLSLRGLGIENVSSSIGELKHLRYVDLSDNPLESLPDSMTKLLNLLVLNLSGCKLRALPDKFRKLINLRFLNIMGCGELTHMPLRFEELTSLQYLSNFEVGKRSVGVQMSGLDALVGLMQQLRGELCITFHMDTNDWSGDECWQLPVSPHTLRIMSYPGTRIPQWGNGRQIALNLASLTIDGCSKVKYLPPISLLPNLKSLYLYHFEELEYLDEEYDASTFFPSLKTLELVVMPKLKGWRRKVATPSYEFPFLSRLQIRSCPKLKPLPLCPLLQNLYLSKDVEIQQLMSLVKSKTSFLEVLTIELCNDITSFTDEALASLRELTIRGCSTLMSLHLTSPRLKNISIRGCNGLMSFQAEALGSLRSLNIENCNTLKILQISNLNALEYLDVSGCPELKLWEENEDIDWDSLPNICELTVDPLPPPEKLPESLLRRQALGELQLKTW